MDKQMEAVIKQILRQVTPTSLERAKMQKLSRDLELKVSDACVDEGLEAVVRVEGSLAKDTWLRGDPDIDVFMRLPTSIPRKSLGNLALRIARKATEGAKQAERFAEHPYLEAFVEDVRVNIVPCYNSNPGDWQSATDRTPYHTDYINRCLKKPQREDVRLLKRFMKGVGVYGAEIKVGGFSGYLCELLVLHFGSFSSVIESMGNHTSKRVIDIEGFYEKRQEDIALLFPEPLVVIDPVDKARNVASAVQPDKLHIFVAASRAFLKSPHEDFFFPLKMQPLSVEELHEALSRRGAALVFLTLSKIEAVPDVLWGQLHRTRKALRKQLGLADFNVLRDGIWSEENGEVTVLVFEFEQRILPSIKIHYGPPIEFAIECEKFLEKYKDNTATIAGPFIAEGRWMVEIRRKFTNGADFLRAKTRRGGRDVGVAELLSKAMPKNSLILVGEEITEHYIYNEGFASYLTEFLSGKPSWLETKC